MGYGGWMAIRRIPPGGQIPSGEPARYRTSDGYIVLRWKVGKRDHLEVLEHRLVAGIPPGPVHHRNHRRDDNRPENLMALDDVAEHSRLHGVIDRKAVAQAYLDGHTTVEIAEMFNTHPGNVSRMMRSQGVVARRQPLRLGMEDRRDEVLEGLAAGESVAALARRFGCGRGAIERIRRDAAGIPPKKRNRRRR